MISRVISHLVTVHFHSMEDVVSEHLNAPHVLQHSSHTFNSLEIKSLQNLYEIVTVKSRNKMRRTGKTIKPHETHIKGSSQAGTFSWEPLMLDAKQSQELLMTVDTILKDFMISVGE